jgi:hypothetical protein
MRQCSTYNSDSTPIVMEHDGVLVVRDDLFPGGTKARFLGLLFNGGEEVVYASPAEGGAQVALATVARRLGSARRYLLHVEPSPIRGPYRPLSWEPR